MFERKSYLVVCFMLSSTFTLFADIHSDYIVSYNHNHSLNNSWIIAQVPGQKHRGEGFMEGFGGKSTSTIRPNQGNQFIQVGDIISTDDGHYRATQTTTLSAPDVRFDFDSYNIGLMFEPQINAFVNKLLDKPQAKVLLEGHTDSVGSSVYNLKLSQRRANAVKSRLIEFGINESRITLKAYGKNRPIASNATPEGRALNRRVEMIMIEPVAP